MAEQSTIISFDGFETAPIRIRNGVDQGCPLSVILYIFYNAGLLRIAQDKSELNVGFMDDITLGARHDIFPQAAAMLMDMLQREEGAQQWSDDHFSLFEHEKDNVLGYTL